MKFMVGNMWALDQENHLEPGSRNNLDWIGKRGRQDSETKWIESDTLGDLDVGVPTNNAPPSLPHPGQPNLIWP